MRKSGSHIRQRDLLLAGIGVLAILTLSLAVGVLAASQTGAQAPAATPAAGPTYEVTSVKPNKSGDGRMMLGMQPGGRFTATNLPLRFFIRSAYGLDDAQIVGAPEWTRTEFYDIVAKAAGDPTPAERRLMDQALLAERFNFQAHRETRELPIYALVLARSDGRLGPKLTPSTVDCDAMRGRGRGAAAPDPARGAPVMRAAIPGPGGAGGARGSAALPPCVARMMPGNVTASGASVAQIVMQLSQLSGRIVQDKTGLTGAYDFELTWTPDQLLRGRDGGPGPDVPAGAPSLFTAVQEQLGLKLDSQRAPVDVLVIDRVERPTPD